MRRHLRLLLPCLALCAGGCFYRFGNPEPPQAKAEISEAERLDDESRALSNLAALEMSLASYVKKEGHPPDALAQLVPKYLSEIPPLELGLTQHAPTIAVQGYPAEALAGGSLQEARLRDTGAWGYVRDGSRAKVFVDCIHFSSRGRPWYRERGVL